MTVTPTILAMRRKADDICRQELAKTLSKLELDDKDQKKVEKLASAISAKLLHDPLLYLKSDSCRGGNDARIDTIRTIFGLEDDDQQR